MIYFLINNNNFLFILLLIITQEWIILFDCIYNFSSVMSIFNFFRIPFFIYFIFFFWMYIWAISSWRRSLYGKFTRGEKKLWFKGLTAFWVGELATVGGIFFAACWMSWGPLPLIHRHFFMSKKSFFIELTLFSYIIWLIYFLKFSLKWYLWKTQFFIIFFILFFINYLLWRDFLVLYTREPLNINYGSRWKYVKLNSLVYSIDNMWWYTYYFGKTKCFTQKIEIFNIFKYIENKNLLFHKIPLTEYEMYTKLNGTLFHSNQKFLFPFKFLFTKNFYEFPQFIFLDFSIKNYYLLFSDKMFTLDSNIFYPRRVGFLTKKITMWYFLFILKIWHHLMLYYWWFLYLLKIYTQKKSSYVWISASSFNVYCCFLLAILIYIYQYLPYLELFIKFKSRLNDPIYIRHLLRSIYLYLKNVITFNHSKMNINNVLDKKNYEIAQTTFKFLKKYF